MVKNLTVFERAEREARRLEREEAARANPNAAAAAGDIPEEAPTCECVPFTVTESFLFNCVFTSDTTIEAPPLIPHKHLCDITGLEAPCTDPTTGLRFHDKSIYEIVKGLNLRSRRIIYQLVGSIP
ncbi:hypothetical protein D9613_010390 [Agrocybe pediades]|uniref:Vps72/YL1 C-terminal domain-containing protein n=1 Tax=Agrocybe pediades TaxID=84607 RepID=A0A8H4VJ86_9AGAR|nr:hypothetical protein D9613_010390 [Agrocybe pediades]